MKAPAERMEQLPGWELVGRGIEDLRLGKHTAEALLVQVGAARLRRAGFDVAPPPAGSPAPEHPLYELLEAQDEPSAHGRYNALLRRLVSFERALAHAQEG